MASYSELQPVLDFDSWERKVSNEDIMVNNFENDHYRMSKLFQSDSPNLKPILEGNEINPHTQVLRTYLVILHIC